VRVDGWGGLWGAGVAVEGWWVLVGVMSDGVGGDDPGEESWLGRHMQLSAVVLGEVSKGFVGRDSGDDMGRY